MSAPTATWSCAVASSRGEHPVPGHRHPQELERPHVEPLPVELVERM
jgi:hypothetical protein